MKAVGGDVVGVDFIPSQNRDKDSPYFIEVNSTPGLMGIETILIYSKDFSITEEILTSNILRQNKLVLTFNHLVV